LQRRFSTDRIEPSLEEEEVKVREIVLEEGNLADGLGKLLSYCGVKKIILRDFRRCPRPGCGSSHVTWDPSKKRHHCPVKTCRWEEEEETLPLRSWVTGRPLRPKEIFEMILESL